MQTPPIGSVSGLFDFYCDPTWSYLNRSQGGTNSSCALSHHQKKKIFDEDCPRIFSSLMHGTLCEVILSKAGQVTVSGSHSLRL